MHLTRIKTLTQLKGIMAQIHFCSIKELKLRRNFGFIKIREIYYWYFKWGNFTYFLFLVYYWGQLFSLKYQGFGSRIKILSQNIRIKILRLRSRKIFSQLKITLAQIKKIFFLTWTRASWTERRVFNAQSVSMPFVFRYPGKRYSLYI